MVVEPIRRQNSAKDAQSELKKFQRNSFAGRRADTRMPSASLTRFVGVCPEQDVSRIRFRLVAREPQLICGAKGARILTDLLILTQFSSGTTFFGCQTLAPMQPPLLWTNIGPKRRAIIFGRKTCKAGLTLVQQAVFADLFCRAAQPEYVWGAAQERKRLQNLDTGPGSKSAPEDRSAKAFANQSTDSWLNAQMQ